MFTIESKLHADNRYICHGGRITQSGAHAHHSVLIRGTKGKHPVRNTVSAEDYEWLVCDPVFQQHLASGSLVVQPVVASPTAMEMPDAVEADAPAAKDVGKESAKSGNGKKAK